LPNKYIFTNNVRIVADLFTVTHLQSCWCHWCSGSFLSARRRQRILQRNVSITVGNLILYTSLFHWFISYFFWQRTVMRTITC